MSDTSKSPAGETMNPDRIADMAHELRSPLGGIESMISLLGESKSAADQAALIAGLKSAAAHLRSVANQLLRPETNAAESVRLGDAVRFFAVSARSRARAAGMRFRQEIAPDCDGMMIADGIALRQMLENVVDNAIRHSNGGEIVLRVRQRPDAPGGDMVECAVLDDGAGFESGAASRLFRRGETSGATSGSGLGLSIVARLAEAAGGKCGAGPRADAGGACVWFALPACARQAARAPQTPTPVEATPILVVDDDPMSRLLMKTVLGHLGHAAETAESPGEATALMQDRVFSAIFTDVAMPGTDGWAFIRALRRAGVEVPIVGVTGRVLPEDRKRTKEAGADWMIDKPVTIHDLRQALIAIGLRDPMIRQVSAA